VVTLYARWREILVSTLILKLQGVERTSFVSIIIMEHLQLFLSTFMLGAYLMSTIWEKMVSLLALFLKITICSNIVSLQVLINNRFDWILKWIVQTGTKNYGFTLVLKDMHVGITSKPYAEILLQLAGNQMGCGKWATW
jgi:hypothetical protein